MKRTIKDLAKLKGRVVLLRVDFNVPLDEKGEIQDYTRIENALPTIKYLIDKKAKVVVMSHLDRPDGYDVRKSLWPIAMLLSRVLACNVSFCTSLIDDEVKQRISLMSEGSVLLLENTRFFKGEVECDMQLSRDIAKLGDVFVNDAFATAHRKNASTYGVARAMPNAIGLLMEKEISVLSKAMEEPKKPFVAVVGGAKIKTKVAILKRFIEKADTLIIGGAMAYTFLMAYGISVGSSMVDYSSIETAREILDYADSKGKRLFLPIDHVAVDEFDSKNVARVVKKLTGNYIGYDIGPETIALYKQQIASAKQIFWNGPMGMYEKPSFANGTREIATAIAESSAYSIVGGGDTVSALNQFKLNKKVNFISTGGGATMEFLEKGTLPCLEVIQERVL